MSWFTDIAGKAETFLNKIDQNAAVALNQAAATIESSKSSRKSSPRNSDANEYDQMFSASNNSTNYVISSENFNTNGTGRLNNESLSISMSQEDSPPGNSYNVEQQVENDSISVITVQERPKSSSKLKSARNKDVRSSNAKTTSLSKPPTKTSTTPVLRGGKKTNEEEELINFLNDSNRKELDEKLVLQTELATQAREVEILYKTNKQLQSDNEALKVKVARYEENKSQESRVGEVELQLKQGENVQKNLKRLLTEKDEEIIKLKKSLDQSYEKLQQLEVLHSTQNRLEIVENENQKLLISNEELKDQATTLNDQIHSSENQILSFKSSLQILESEFSSYKEKAKSILKQKDELLTSLQDGTLRKSEGHDAENQFVSEINTLKSERELLNGEIAQCRATTDSLREETQRLESELFSLRGLISQSQKQLSDEKSLSSTFQDENLQLRQQLSSMNFEFDLEKSERRKLEEWKGQRDSEENSQGQVGRISPVDRRNNSYSNGDTEENLRMRITALSQSLLEKQSLINNLSSDKQLLQINVERLQEQVREVGNEHQSSNSSGFSQTVISNRPLYLSESPWDGMSTAGVKRAFTTVDSLCCQAGLALRRRPNLRLGFCIYIILLHFWVLFILFHSFSHVPLHEPSNGNGAGPAPAPVR